MNNNCPVCNKSGLPDYTKNNVVCPQCNSDLKPFLLLHSVSKPKKSKSVFYTIIGISLISIVLLGFFLKSNSEKNELVAANMILNDSISKIQSETVAVKIVKEPDTPISKQNIFIDYVVRKGDYPYKIARFFYNDGNRYKQIEVDNNLEQPYTLKVGQILKIKIPQESWEE